MFKILKNVVKTEDNISSYPWYKLSIWLANIKEIQSLELFELFNITKELEESSNLKYLFN